MTKLQHEAVLDASVIGVPNEEFGEEAKAVVQFFRGSPRRRPHRVAADLHSTNKANRQLSSDQGRGHRQPQVSIAISIEDRT